MGCDFLYFAVTKEKRKHTDPLATLHRTTDQVPLSENDWKIDSRFQGSSPSTFPTFLYKRAGVSTPSSKHATVIRSLFKACWEALFWWTPRHTHCGPFVHLFCLVEWFFLSVWTSLDKLASMRANRWHNWGKRHRAAQGHPCSRVSGPKWEGLQQGRYSVAQ